MKSSKVSDIKKKKYVKKWFECGTVAHSRNLKAKILHYENQKLNEELLKRMKQYPFLDIEEFFDRKQIKFI